MKRCKLRNARPKALFGEAAAILTAAGMQTAATMAAAGMQTKSTISAAKQQADATRNAAKQQAQAITKQTENDKALQENLIAFNKEENEKARDLQKEIQMNLQLLTGSQNTAARNEATRLVVSRGGKTRKLNNTLSLRGVNMPFSVTDGGGVLPLGKTPEGYDLYEIIGNDHEHYHKTRGGKNRTGVGFKFANGQTIEGEGNQTPYRKGELLLVTPTDAMFISKHSIKGFNPSNAVLAGMHPVQAFNIQESIKSKNGYKNKGKKANTGGEVYPIFQNGYDFNTDTIAPTATGISYILQNNSELNENNMNYGSRSKYNMAKRGCRVKAGAGTSTNPYNSYYYLGAGINSLGNLGGSLITTIGNNRALKYITAANNEAAGILANAYGNLKGIDMRLLKRSDFAAPHALAAVQAPIINTNPQRTLANRSLLRTQSAVNRGSLSSAAAQNRNSRAETYYNDMIGQIENSADEKRQGIIQGNMARITQVANENANRDAMSNQQYANTYLNLLAYNNDIDNKRILGAADARSSAITQNAGTRANTVQANSQSWANAIANTANTWGNALTTVARNNFTEDIIRASGDADAIKLMDEHRAEIMAQRKQNRRDRINRLKSVPVLSWMFRS